MRRCEGSVEEAVQTSEYSPLVLSTALSSRPQDFGELHLRLADRVALIREERRAIARQKSLLFSLALTTAIAAVGLVLYGLAHAMTDSTLANLELPELAGIATGLASGAFGWLTKVLLSRQAELDVAEKGELEMLSLLAYISSIRDRQLRNKVAAHVAGVVAIHIYSRRFDRIADSAEKMAPSAYTL
jgi:hypothetical protein